MDIWRILEHAVERWPDRVALVDGDLRRTWSQTHARAAGLAQELDLERGDRVAYLGRNSAAFFEAYFASAGAGAILVPLNTRLAPSELAQVIEDAAPRVVLCDTGLEKLLPEGTPRQPTGSWTEARAGFVPVEVAPRDPAQLYYTSGTTGRCKGVILTQENVVEHALAATSELDLADDDVWAHVAPMFHLADAWATFALTWVGGVHVMAPRFDAREVLDLFARENVTVTNLVPTMLVRLVAEAERRGSGEHRLRLLLTGGAPIAPDTIRRALALLRCEYAQTYGMTETSPFLTLGLLRPHHRQQSEQEQLARRARTGRPFETIELQVVDESDQLVADDDRAVGEIRVRGTTVSPGYWQRPEETALAFRDGWLYTGDMATVDDEGYVNIVDRKKDLILTGGENVYSIEVEHVLAEHPAVLEAAVFGVPHPEWGQEVRAAVVLRDEADPAALLAHCRERMAGFKCPREIEIRDELPRTGSGKLSKATLRAEQRA